MFDLFSAHPKDLPLSLLIHNHTEDTEFFSIQESQLKNMKYINSRVTNGLSHPYQLDESTYIFRGIGINFSLFGENHVTKKNSSRWDAAFCGVTSGAILFACPIKMTPGLYGLIYVNTE